MEQRNFIGIGLYTVPQASRLTGVPRTRIRRWLKGYNYRYQGKTRSSQPLWATQLPLLDKTCVVGFLDLLEVRFVEAFLKAGVSLPTIKLAARRAHDWLGADHPFSTRRFRTDGKGIFADLEKETGEKALLDLVHRQFAFSEIITPSLYEGLEYAPDGQATAWRPDLTVRKIILDPAREFGQPIIEDAGVQTATLAEAVKVEGSVEAVAALYEIDLEAVRQAVLFEARLTA